jgi:cell wall-associated NlpC family hydrolase
VTAPTTRGRYRAARRPITPLDDLAQAASGSVAAVGRHAGVAAATSGIVVGMIGVSPAHAAPTELSALPAVDTAGLAAGALTALATAPQVTVDADTEWSFDIPKVKVVKEEVAPPPPPPVRSETPTSRDNAPRTETPAKDGGKVPQAVKGNKVLEIAARYVGVPYRSGGSSPKGFDCSGFTQYVYGKLGISLPRTTGAQKNAGTIVSRKDAKPGDIIWSPGHVGIYAGDNMQIDAPRPGKTIQFRSIWQSNPVFVRITG